jgi:catechol 2,3-dioxygenase-like lactoylglutathione lyase family enzyme
MSGTPAAGRPENLRFISGVIVVSRQAERAVEFYRDVLGLPLAEERHGDTELHWGCELGDVHFAIHPAEDDPDSQITAVRDPDGNLVELTQLGAGWVEHLKVHRAAGNDLIPAWGTRLAG